jgi:hypothetical protein
MRPAVGAQHDTHLGPALADLRDDARRLLDRARRRVDVGGPQLRRQQVATAEDVERQIAVATIVAVEEPPFLPAVHRIVGGVEIEDDLLGGRLVRLQEQRDEQPFDGNRVVGDLVVARRLRPAQLETVQRRLAGHRSAVLAPRRQLAGEDRHHRIVAQLVVVVDVLVAKRQPEHALPDQRRHKVLHQLRAAMIAEAAGKAINQFDRSIRRAEQQRPGIRGDRPAVKPGHHGTPFDRCKLEQFRATLCWHRGISLDQRQFVAAQRFSQSPRPDALRLCEISGLGARLAIVRAPPIVNVFVPRLNEKASTAPVIFALTPARLLPPTTLIALSPTAPPTAPFRTLPPPSANVPVFAPAVVVRAPMTVVFGARLIVPSAAKFVAVIFVDPLLKFTAPVPVTFNVVAKT